MAYGVLMCIPPRIDCAFRGTGSRLFSFSFAQTELIVDSRRLYSQVRGKLTICPVVTFSPSISVTNW